MANAVALSMTFQGFIKINGLEFNDISDNLVHAFANGVSLGIADCDGFWFDTVVFQHGLEFRAYECACHLKPSMD